MESQYSQFKSDLNNETKPKGTAFLTDERKDLLSIMGPGGQQQGGAQSQIKPVKAAAKKKTISNPEEIIMGNMTLPKFEDDD